MICKVDIKLIFNSHYQFNKVKSHDGRGLSLRDDLSWANNAVIVNIQTLY